MATIPQMEANRLNAQKSTGPRSAEGKASSRFNAYKHGAYARARIIPGEDEADLTHLSEDYVLDLRPEGVVDLRLVDTLIHSDWNSAESPFSKPRSSQAWWPNRKIPRTPPSKHSEPPSSKTPPAPMSS